jgi:hypothetical protein
MTSSATAIEFFPGQLATKMPRLEAAGTSIVSTPAPARMTRLRLAPDLSAAADTRVPRTMRICGSTRLQCPGQGVRTEVRL